MNNVFFAQAILFSQADSGGTIAGGGAGQGGGSMVPFVIQMVVIFAAFWFFLIHLPSKRERTRLANLYASIKKNDRVLTTSGIIGAVTNVSKDSNPPEVTLRIDETTNAKLRVTLNSIAQVLGDEPSADTPSK